MQLGLHTRFRQNGFTLAELMISLLILAVIATFSIPKVLHSQQDARKKAVLKETIAAINDVVYQAVITQDPALNPSSDEWQYFADHLNYVEGDMACGNIWTQPYNSTYTSDCQSFKLANGAIITGFTSCCDYAWAPGVYNQAVTIDWNGVDGPNTYGDDQMNVIFSWGTETFCGWGGGYPCTKPGTVVPEFQEASNVTIYESIFGNI